jgi:hypothetical protein
MRRSPTMQRCLHRIQAEAQALVEATFADLD